MRRITLGICIGLALGLGVSTLVRPASVQGDDAKAAANRVFELRTYTANEGKLGDLNARFRDHTMRLFEKHGMKNVIYLTPLDEKKSGNTLVYLISHESREAAEKNWAGFRADPEWMKAAKASEVNGKLVKGVTTEYLAPTDYSPVK